MPVLTLGSNLAQTAAKTPKEPFNPFQPSTANPLFYNGVILFQLGFASVLSLAFSPISILILS
jgi:hypothetical protein